MTNIIVGKANCERQREALRKKKHEKVLTNKMIDDNICKYLVFSFEGATTIILNSSMAEHPAVNRRVAGSSPA